MKFIRTLPRWYVVALAALFVCYLGGWAYTVHLAQVERAAGAAYVTPVGAHDSTSYATLAENLLHGRFVDQTIGGQYEYFHTPGYPAFAAALLWVSGGSFFAATFVQVLLVFATTLLIVVLGERFVSRRVGLWASLLFVVNPLVPYIALQVATDTLFTFLFTLGVTLIVARFVTRPLIITLAAAVIFAAAVYVRPVGFIAYPVFVLPMLVLAYPWRTKLAYAVLLLAVVTLLLVPWMLRNQAHSGVLSFSSLFSLNMAYYELPHYLAGREGISLDAAIQQVAQQSGVPEEANSRGYPVNWYNLASSPALDRYIFGVVFQNPVVFGAWHLYNSTGFFLNPPVDPLVEHTNLKGLLLQGRFLELLKAVTNPWWLFVERIGTLAGLALALWGAWTLRRKPLAWAFAFIILYFAALSGVAASSRLRLPVEPLLCLFIVAGLFAAARQFRRLAL